MTKATGIKRLFQAVVGLTVIPCAVEATAQDMTGNPAQSTAPAAAPSTAQSPQMVRDVVYAHVDGMAMVYDVMPPSGSPNGAGVVFVISGGFLSSREQQELIAPVAHPLVDAGFTVFYLRHPSTPRYMAPEIYHALQLGMDHILTHAPRFAVDPSRIGVMGMSTGGLLALLLGLDVDAAAAPSRPAAQSGPEAQPRPAAVVAYMPVVDMRTQVGNVQATPSLGFPPELAPALSPVDFISPDDPPVLFIHGVNDVVVPLQENSERMLALMEASGLISELVAVEAGHELFSGEAREVADQATVAWFETYLLRER